MSAPRSRNFWIASEEAFLVQTVISLRSTIQIVNESTTVDDWRPVLHAMRMEQMRHLPGGDLFVQDPWPKREFTYNSIKRKWQRVESSQASAKNVSQAIAQAIFQEPAQQSADALENEEWGLDELPEELLVELQADLDRMRAIEFGKGWAETQTHIAQGSPIEQPILNAQAARMTSSVPTPQKSAAQQPAAYNPAQSDSILQQPVVDPPEIEASRKLLALMTDDQAEDEKFWSQFQTSFGNK